MVEQLICNQQVKGSSPFVRSLPKKRGTNKPRASDTRGRLSAEVSRARGRGDGGGEGAVGCPSGQREQTVNLPRLALRRFESFPHHFVPRGRSSVGRASAFQAEGRGFEPRRPLLVLRAEGPKDLSKGSRSSVGRARPW